MAFAFNLPNFLPSSVDNIQYMAADILASFFIFPPFCVPSTLSYFFLLFLNPKLNKVVLVLSNVTFLKSSWGNIQYTLDKHMLNVLVASLFFLPMESQCEYQRGGGPTVEFVQRATNTF